MSRRLIDVVSFLAGAALALGIILAGIAATPWKQVVFG